MPRGSLTWPQWRPHVPPSLQLVALPAAPERATPNIATSSDATTSTAAATAPSSGVGSASSAWGRDDPPASAIAEALGGMLGHPGCAELWLRYLSRFRGVRWLHDAGSAARTARLCQNPAHARALLEHTVAAYSTLECRERLLARVRGGRSACALPQALHL